MKVTVSSKGQVVIPASIREKLGIRKGEKLEVRLDGSRIIMEPVGRAVRSRRGILKGEGGRVLEFLLEERKRDAGLEELRI